MIENTHSKQFVIIYQHKIERSGKLHMLYVKMYAEGFQEYHGLYYRDKNAH